MIWAKEKTAELIALCREGKSNAFLAKHFGVPVTQIYAKRSQLGITIDKCKTTATPHIAEDADKRAFMLLLKRMLMAADIAIEDAELSDDGRLVNVSYINGHARSINVDGDSKLAMALDVVSACM